LRLIFSVGVSSPSGCVKSRGRIAKRLTCSIDAALGERVREGVVLLAGAPDPQDVVEEQLVLVARREPLELPIGTVQRHAPQRPDLGPDERPGGGLDGHDASSTGTVSAERFCHQRIPT